MDESKLDGKKEGWDCILCYYIFITKGIWEYLAQMKI